MQKEPDKSDFTDTPIALPDDTPVDLLAEIEAALVVPAKESGAA
jgi:hypothetical protein